MRFVENARDRFDINIAALRHDGQERDKQTKILEVCRGCIPRAFDRLLGKARVDQGTLL
jgi:hypothetical protein